MNLLRSPTHDLLVTGKGGVGKTFSSAETAISVADARRRVLLVRARSRTARQHDAHRGTLGITPLQPVAR